MTRGSLQFAFLNVGHFYDHFFLLIFSTVAAVTLAGDWGLSYGALIAYATPGFIAFGVGSLPAGWLADKWSREGMMVVFFLGIGLSSVATAFATTPVEMATGLFAIGLFAAIYHPVGIALVMHDREKTGMAIAVNGVFGNMGVAAAALITGFLIDLADWRWAFALPGAIATATGVIYALFLRAWQRRPLPAGSARKAPPPAMEMSRRIFVRLLAIVLISTCVGGLLFQSGTFALPKIFDERLGDLAGTATLVGWYAFVVFTIAAIAQLIVGWMLDTRSIRTVFATVAFCQIVTFALMVSLTGWAALLVATGFMLAIFGQIPINDVLVGRMSKPEWRSRLLAARYIVTFTVMASSVPLIGWIHSLWGFEVLFQVLAVAAGVTFITVLMLPRTRAVTGVSTEAAE